jgi:GNAT superfamily N-acetyltransferase
MPTDEQILSLIGESQIKKPEIDSKINFREAQKVNPDSYAESYSLAKQRNLPVESVEKNLDTVKFDMSVESYNNQFQDLRQKNPNTLKLLTDKHKSKLAYDDIDNLKNAENVARERSKERSTTMEEAGAMFEKQISYLGYLGAAYGLVDAETASGVIADSSVSLAEVQKRLPNYMRSFNKEFEQAEGFLDTAGAIVTNPRAIGRTAVTQLANSAFPIGLGLAGGEVGAKVGVIGGSVIPGVGTAAGGAIGAGVGFLGGTFMGGTVTEIAAYIDGELQQKGVDVTNKAQLLEALQDEKLMEAIRSEAERKGLTTAAIDTLFAGFGGRFARGISKGTGVGEKVARRGGDIAVESVGESVGEAGGQYAATGEVDIKDAVLEGVTGIGQSAIQATAATAYSQGQTVYENTKELIGQGRDWYKGTRKSQIDAVHKVAQESKLAKRSPDVFKEVIENTNPDKNFFIDANDGVAYFQSLTPEDREKLYSTVPNLKNQVAEAYSSGEDIEINFADYMAYIASDTKYDGIRDIVRNSPDDYSIEELDQLQAEQLMADLGYSQEEIESILSGEPSGAEVYANQLRDKIIATEAGNGISNVGNAQAVADYISTMRETLSNEVEQVGLDNFVKDNFNIEIQTEQKPLKPRVTIEDVDIENAKTFQPRTVQQPPERGLYNYIVSLGGIDPNGQFAKELASRDILPTTNIKQGKDNGRVTIGRLFNEGGLADLDNLPISEIAQYLPEELQMFDEDGRGYANLDEVLTILENEVFDVTQNVTQLDGPAQERALNIQQAIEAEGLDINELSPQQIREVIQKQSEGVENTFQEQFTSQDIDVLFESSSKLTPEEIADAPIPQEAASDNLPETSLEEQPNTEPEAPIDDFGEKLSGAKKDLWKGYSKSLGEKLPENLKDITLSKHFPEPDYETLIKEGVDIKALAVIKAFRDYIPSKPKKQYKLEVWASQLEVLRDFSHSMITGKIEQIQVLKKLEDINYARTLRGLAERINLYTKLGYPSFTKAKDWKIRESVFSQYKGEIFNPPKALFEIEYKRRTVGVADREEDAFDALRDKLAEAPSGAKQVKLEIYTYTKTGEVFIGKKVASGKFIELKTGFKSTKDARNFLQENEQSLIELLNEKKKTPPLRRSTNDPRKGEDYRMGDNITPEKFADEFGFRGVQFGNYVEQKKRQEDINNAYDGLLDLADLIGVPPRALSLNGELGLAFGARGSGGIDPASAHYEPDSIVINLTKKSGAGSLAHEWFHAFDNYIDRKRGGKDFITNKPGIKKEVVDGKLEVTDTTRPELIEAFNKVMKAITESELPKRSRMADGTRSKDYFSTPLEMAARAFESFIISKAAKENKSNDYLANIFPENLMEDLDSYQYPLATEQESINEAFQNLFDTVQYRKTEKGVELFQSAPKTDGQAFKDWFGDSKVVDEEGKPLVVYHGTTADFDVFEDFAADEYYGGEGRRFFFTTDKDAASTYASNQVMDLPDDGANVLPVYLSLKKPLIVDAAGKSYYDAAGKGNDIDGIALEASSSGKYDGVIVKNVRDDASPSKSKKPIDVYIAFQPEQIKSVNNKGSFDSNDPRILYQSGASNEANAIGMDILQEMGQSRVAGGETLFSDNGDIKIFESDNLGSIGQKSFRAVNYADGKIVGALQFTTNGKRTKKATIQNVYVEPDYRRQKIAANLLKKARESFDIKHSKDLTDAGKAFAKADGTYYQGDNNQDTPPQGSVQFLPDGLNLITLFDKANKSTLLHESAHIYLNVYQKLMEKPNVPQEMRDRWVKLLEWLGVEDGSQIGVNEHEKFAEGFEVYLEEGNAPSLELKNLFRQFKVWLRKIYQFIRQDNKVKLNDDVRDFMDRMAASEEQIEAYRNVPIYKVNKDFVSILNKQEQEAYQKQVTEAYETAKENLLKKLLKEKTREKTSWWKNESKSVENEERKILEESPIQRVVAFLQKGELLGEETPANTQPVKLNRRDVIRLYGKEAIKRLPKGVVSKRMDEGAPLDIVADSFDFSSGDEMIQSMFNYKPFNKALADAVEKTMLERHGDLLNDGSIENEVLAEMENAERGKLLELELGALLAKTNQKMPSIQELRRLSTYVISQQQLHKFNPNTYYQKMKKYAREGGRALGKKDYIRAAEFKKKELFNHFAYKNALKAKKKMEKAVKYVKKFTQNGTRKGIDIQHLRHIDNILYQFKLGRFVKQPKQPDKRFVDFVQEQMTESNNIILQPDIILNGLEKKYTTLNFDSFNQVIDTIKNIEAVGRNERNIELLGEKMDIREAAEKAAQSIRANTKETEQSKRVFQTKLDKSKEFVSGLDKEIARMEFIFKELDGGKVNGTLAQLFINPLSDAQNNSFSMQKDVNEQIKNILNKNPNVKENWSDKIYDKGLQQSFVKKNIVQILLNVGNESNYEKLTNKEKGGIADSNGKRIALSDSDIERFKSYLTKEDWDSIQAIWDMLEGMRPQVEDVYSSLTGLDMKVIDAKPVQTPFGTYKGGYFPVVYDPRASKKARENEAKSIGVLENSFEIPTVNKGQAKTRTNFAAPIITDFDSTLSNHLRKTVHLITHGKVIRDLNRLSMRGEFEEAIIERAGVETYSQIKPWLQAIAKNSVYDNPIDRTQQLIRHLRTGTTALFLGFGTGTGIKQAFGNFTTLAAITRGELSKKNAYKGYKGYITAPKQTAQFAYDNSKELEERMRIINADIANGIRDAERGKSVISNIQLAGFMFISYAQMYSVDMPTWLSGYYEGLERHGGDKKQAINYADALLRQTQGSGAIKDLAKLQRGNEVQKAAATMFGTYILGVLYPKIKEVFVDGGSRKNPLRAAITLVPLIMMPAVVEGLMVGGEPEDDDTWAEWAALKSLQYGTSSVPLVGGITNSLIGGKYDFTLSPIESPINMVIRGARKIDDPDISTLRAAVVAVGLATKLPTYQPFKTIDEIAEIARGEDDFDVREVFFGAPELK